MKVVASRELAHRPSDLEVLPGGTLVVCSGSKAGQFCEAYDADLKPGWSTQHEGLRALITGPDGAPWLLDGAGAFTVDEHGRPATRVTVKPLADMELVAFAAVEGGFVFAWQHARTAPVCGPVITRVDLDGRVRWSTKLSVGPISHEGVVVARATDGWKQQPKPPWKPSTWVSMDAKLCVSGDAVLLHMSEMPRSGIGCAYAVALADGALRFTTKLGPVSQTASLGTGAFLVGYQGYGAFETLRYEPDGRVSVQWASHGYYVIREDDVRVIEMENVLPSKMHLVRLQADGSVTKGEWLDRYYTSEPHLHADGTLIFFRNGMLQAARDLHVDTRLMLHAPEDDAHARAIVGQGRRIYCAHGRYIADDKWQLVCVEL